MISNTKYILGAIYAMYYFVCVCVNQYVSCVCIVKLSPICVHVPTLKLIWA